MVYNGFDQVPGTSRLRKWPPAWLPILAITLALIVWPIIGYGARQAWLKSKNRIEDWLPASFPETRNLEHFFQRFGSDEFLMISWQGCALEDPRAAKLTELLLQPTQGGRRFFDKAFTGDDVLGALRSSQPNLPEAAARSRLAKLFIGADLERSCVIALVSQVGLEDRAGAVQQTRLLAQQATGLPDEEIHLAGSTADSVAVDEASSANLMELNLISSLLCFAILLVSLRNFWLVGTLFLGALLNEQLALAIIYFSGGHVDSVLLLVANLSFVLTISAGLHYLSYFRDAIGARQPSPAAAAVRSAFVPSLLSALTTSIGFVSLCTSEIVPIRRFGIYAAAVVPINTLLIITIMSIHATWAAKRSWRWRPVPLTVNLNGHQATAACTWTAPLIRILNGRPVALVLAWMVAIGIAGFGITNLTTSVGTHKLLPADNKLIRDYKWLEAYIGPLVPVELVMSLPRDSQLSTFERMQTLDLLRREVSTLDEVQCTWSVLNLLPPVPISGGMRSTVQKSILKKAANNCESQFRDMRLLYQNDHEECWRLTARVSGSDRTEYEQLLSDLAVAIDRFHQQVPSDSISIEVSGGVPFVYRTQRQLLLDLLNSFTSAFLLIAATMGILFRSVRAGLLSMLPNVTPAFVVFGIMGWAGLEVELGTVLTASVIMGVCVDDTLHLITHFCRARSRGLEPTAAVHEALSTCGGAMVQTAVVCGVGMLVFALSPFTPIARFAWLTFSLLMVGLVSDLILTPAILLTPLHHVFYRSKPQKQLHEERQHAPTAPTAPTPVAVEVAP